MQSSTRKIIWVLTLSGSPGASKVTVGLSWVGPPPVTSRSQLPSSCKTADAVNVSTLDTLGRPGHTLG
jgi:hypothetical protein